VTLGIVFGVALSAGLVVYIPIYQEAVDDAQNIDRKLTVSDENPTIIYSGDKTHKILYRVAAIRRKVIDLNDPKYPKYLRYAIVAAEDRRFYDHKGVDPIGLGRVLFTAVRDRHVGSGGSTISMQLAKLMINGDARTPLRKLKDIATAQQIETLKSKDEILNLYANYAYYGEHAYGIERAAQVYFGKPAEKLTLGESAMLARSVRLPGRVNPIKTPDKMLNLRDYVLGVMREENWITPGEYDAGIREVPKVNKRPSYSAPLVSKDAGYFVDHVLAQLAHDFPDIDFKEGGYRIETNLNWALQQRTIQAVDDTLAQFKGQQVNDGAIVLMDPEGRILSEVGGPDYARRQYNVVTQGLGRQPGSAFKPIVYATALKSGRYTPYSTLSNAPIHRKDGRKWWNPQNASRRENARSYSMYTALAASINLPAIHTIDELTPHVVAKEAKEAFGIKTDLMPVASLALGSTAVKPLEMLEAYSVFTLGGNRAEPQPIARVIGPDGNVLREYGPVVHTAALDPKVAQQMDELLKGPVSRGGTAVGASVVPNARGKTGTTNDHKDAWFCGYSDGLTAVAWTGNTNFKSKSGGQLSMGSRVFGGTVAVKIWIDVMQAAHQLGLANGVKASPGARITVAAAPDEAPHPYRERHTDDDAIKNPITPVEPNPVDPVDGGAPDPASVEPPPVSDAGGDDPDKTPPPTEPPATSPPPVEATPVPVRPVSTKPTTRRSDPPKPRPVEQTEDVMICVDTGLRAGMYCPETVTRSFPKGRAPRGRCTIHHA